MQPTLYIDLNRVKQSFTELQKALPNFKLAYAIKANPNSEVITTLNKSNAFFEAASFYEIEYLFKLGIPAEKIIFSNPIKPINAIQKAIENNIFIMSFDAEEELDKFIDLKKESKLLFRIEVPNKGSLWPLNKKFGCPQSQWGNVFEKMKNWGLFLEGITFHVGSQCESIDTWDLALNKAWEAIQLAKKYNLNPLTLNIGGGFPIFLSKEVPTVRDIGRIVSKHLALWEESGYRPTGLIAEPGRFIVGTAGTLVTNVIGIATRQSRKWVFLDCGIFSGLLETIENIRYPVLCTSKNKSEKITLCGPTCDTLDKIFDITIPSPKIGDKILFKGAGAYTTVYSSNFNGFPHPEVIVTNEMNSLIKKRLQF